MNVFGHHHVTTDDEVVPLSHDLKRTLKKATRRRGAEIREPPITTEGEEMKASGLMVTDQPLGHPKMLHPESLAENEKDRLGL
jgi:hypothetical protein